MVYLVEVKPGLWYAYRCVRLPGHKNPVKEYLGKATRAMVKTERRKLAEAARRKKRSPTDTDPVSGQSISNSSKGLDYRKSVLRLFDPDLSANGQTWSIDDILEQLEQIYGFGHEKQIGSAVVALVDSGRLQEISPGNYRRKR